MDKKFYLLIFVFIFINSIILAYVNNQENNPEKMIKKLYNAIDSAKEKGDYNCCIEPACTMCYLGHWKFEKGTCHCDEAIAEGRNEDVCPECVSGLEKGLCKSAEDICELDPGLFE